MNATPTATPTAQRTRIVTVRIHDLSTLTARGVWMGTDKRDAINAVRIEIDPAEWEAMRLDRAGRNTVLARVIDRRIEPILNPLRRTHGSSIRVEVEAHRQIPRPPTRHGGEPGEPVQGFLHWGEREVGVIRVREAADDAAEGSA